MNITFVEFITLKLVRCYLVLYTVIDDAKALLLGLTGGLGTWQ